MSSKAQLSVMETAAKMLEQFGVPYEMRVLKPTRSSARQYARVASSRGLNVLIASAAAASDLASALSADTALPVVGVPVAGSAKQSLSLLRAFMKEDRPSSQGAAVATVAINNAANAALLAVQCLALTNRRLERALASYKHQLAIKNRRPELRALS
jgi:phosphoribosylaminoimidazole carboxylase PurE protein